LWSSPASSGSARSSRRCGVAEQLRRVDWIVAQIDTPSGAAGLEADFKLSVSNNDPPESSPAYHGPWQEHRHCCAIAFRGKAWNSASAVKELDIEVAATAIGSIRDPDR
jgi:hypothetical protein